MRFRDLVKKKEQLLILLYDDLGQMTGPVPRALDSVSSQSALLLLPPRRAPPFPVGSDSVETVELNQEGTFQVSSW